MNITDNASYHIFEIDVFCMKKKKKKKKKLPMIFIFNK